MDEPEPGPPGTRRAVGASWREAFSRTPLSEQYPKPAARQDSQTGPVIVSGRKRLIFLTRCIVPLPD